MGYLNNLARQIRNVNRANGWKLLEPPDWSNPYRVPACLALIHSEVSEALEAFRNNDRENFAEELADVLIRILDAAPGLEIDLDEVVAAKIDRNRTRGFRHGGKRV